MYKELNLFPGFEISECGEIRNMHNHKFIKQRLNNKRYWVAMMPWNGSKKLFSVHRLLAITYLPNPANKPQVNHKDGNRSNNELLNLEWCTQAENTQHAYDIGLAFGRKGQKHHNCKLCESDILEIRRLYYEEKLFARTIASKFSVTQTAVSQIVNNVTWTHVTHKYKDQICYNRKRCGSLIESKTLERV